MDFTVRNSYSILPQTLMWIGKILPIVVFPVLAILSAKLTFGRLLSSGISLSGQCDQTPYFSSSYLGLDLILNKAVCPMVDFFVVVLGSTSGRAFLTYVSGTTLPLLLLPTFEAYRPGQHKILKHPVFWLFLCQIVTMGVALPLYWLAFILTSGPKKTRITSAKLFTQADAEALVFGLIVGAVIPTACLLNMDDPVIIAIWGIYPIFIGIAESLHLFFRPPSRHPQSGFVTLLVFFFACFTISSSFHISLMWPLVKDLDKLKELLLPSTTPIPPDAHIALHYLDLLQWDVLFAYTSTAIATFWFVENTKQVFAIALWYAFSIPVFGYGAAVAGFAIWRNGFL